MSTKACPKCGDTHLVLMNTLNLKYCVCCHTWIVWTKDEDQEDYR